MCRRPCYVQREMLVETAGDPQWTANCWDDKEKKEEVAGTWRKRSEGWIRGSEGWIRGRAGGRRG